MNLATKIKIIIIGLAIWLAVFLLVIKILSKRLRRYCPSCKRNFQEDLDYCPYCGERDILVIGADGIPVNTMRDDRKVVSYMVIYLIALAGIFIWIVISLL